MADDPSLLLLQDIYDLATDAAGQNWQSILHRLAQLSGARSSLLQIRDQDCPLRLGATYNLPDDVLRDYELYFHNRDIFLHRLGPLTSPGVMLTQDLAERRQVRLSTIPSQVRSLLFKTGTTRQGDLLRLLLSLPRAETPGE